MDGPVVVGVDGSTSAASALAWAAAVARRLGAEVVAVHALGLLVHVGAVQEPAETHRRQVEALMAGPWTEPLRLSGVRHRTEVVEGNPVIGLLAAASAHDASFVVVGRRGAGGFPGLQLGSTSQQLAQHAEVPVVIVPLSGAGGR